MPLISCPDCGREISDSAAACLGCGRPMELGEARQPATSKGYGSHWDVPVRQRPEGGETVTTQQTAKKFKGQMLAGGALCALGVVLMVAGEMFGSLLAAVGVGWYLGARAWAWWNNG